MIAVGSAVVLASGTHSQALFILGILVVSALLGNMLVLPIGGADMPVVISLLNAFTGLSAAATGVALSNPAMIVAGMIVGASGTILTNLMAKAMNRSVPAIVAGGFGGEVAAPAGAAGATGGTVRSTSAQDVAIQLAYARLVVIAPGYGMAVAQAQHAVHELQQALEAKGVEVEYAIHPVAGRMPGHMNVLLAEANVPYELLREMDEINPEFSRTDVTLVIGANDVDQPGRQERARLSRSMACRSSRSTDPPPWSCSSARWPPGSPASTTRCSTSRRRRCCSATPRPPSPRSPPRSRRCKPPQGVLGSL